MAKTRRLVPRTFTLEQKIAFVSEIARRYPSEGRPLTSIADELGISASNYYNWTKAGIRPRPPEPPRRTRPPAPPPYDRAEREQLLAEVDRRRASGLGILAACREVGISDKSYRKWRDAAAPPPAMVPVEVTALVPVSPPAPSALTLAPPRPSGEPEQLTLLAPGGYRIEGLGVETAAQLLRALAC